MFEAEKHGKSTRRAAVGPRTGARRSGLLFGGGFALGVATTALGFLLLGPELSTPPAEELAEEETEQEAQGALAASPPSAAEPSEPGQPSAAPQPSAAAENPLQPVAAPAEPPPSAAPAEAVAASPAGTETTPSAATEAPAEPARPQAPAPQPPAQAAPAKPTALATATPAPPRAAQPAAPAPKATPAPAAAPPPAAPGPPVDPNSQDAKLAAAAQVRLNAGTPIDSMLDQAFSPSAGATDKAGKPAGQATLPPAPTRDDVIKAMSVLVPAIRGCAQGQSGMAPVSIVVHSDGRVESAALSSGPFQGTASGRCMEGVVRRARFPRFSQPSFRVQFPFAIQ